MTRTTMMPIVDTHCGYRDFVTYYDELGNVIGFTCRRCGENLTPREEPSTTTETP